MLTWDGSYTTHWRNCDLSTTEHEEDGQSTSPSTDSACSKGRVKMARDGSPSAWNMSTSRTSLKLSCMPFPLSHAKNPEEHCNEHILSISFTHANPWSTKLRNASLELTTACSRMFKKMILDGKFRLYTKDS